MATSLTLYDLETHLAALLDSEPGEEQQQEYRAELTEALRTTAAKRDRVAAFLAHLGSQITLAKEEEARLKARRERLEKAAERLGSYVLGVMQETGQKRLEGNTATFRAVKCPPSVEITDEYQIPKQYCPVTVTLSRAVWDEVVSRLPADIIPYSRASKSEIRKALDRGEEVPGAHLVKDKLRLVVE